MLVPNICALYCKKTAHIYVAEAFYFAVNSLKIAFSQFCKTAIIWGQKGVLLNLLL